MPTDHRKEARTKHERRPPMGYFTTDDGVFQLGLTPYQYAVFSYLLRCANAKGECWPSIRKMARTLGIAPNTVRKALRDLEARMLLTVTRRKSDHGDQDTNMYVLLYRGGGSPREPRGSRDEPGGSPGEGGVVHVVNQGGSRGEPEGLPIEGQPIGRTYRPPPGKKFKRYDEETKRLIRSLYVT